ncbi:hypothetical protein EUGRSUZ_E02292 [Eucalyptus grandis]|uniref:Uncharacterized protein n=1 Tax=Eucalyptus grandis TaxID=71139 RepID=A0ACC3KXE9_EUCGR|nr:hypothetical protein EUGRSUZ_E02292 [Eucalyptus grandis]
MPEPSVVSWTMMIDASFRFGQVEWEEVFFKQMPIRDLAAWNVMVRGCCEDVRMDNVVKGLVTNMLLKTNSIAWLVWLSSCKMHSNLDLAEKTANYILDLEPRCSAAYVLLSTSMLLLIVGDRGLVKQPGSSRVTIKRQKHLFHSSDKSHPLSESIYWKLDWLKMKLKGLGYVPDNRFSLHDIKDKQKENPRICGDCHSTIVLIAKIDNREIIERNSGRFHHFRGGICSCGDY